MSQSDLNDDNEPSYEVGYGKPPAHSRFKPGQSGNPKGKKKGAKDYKTIINGVMSEKVTVRTPRGQKKMSKLEAVLQTAMNKALKGDPKAIDQVLKIAREYGLSEDVANAIDAAAMKQLSEEDRAIMERGIPAWSSGRESGLDPE